MMNHIICSFTKEEAQDKELKYIRLLGFNENGQKYINKIKKELSITLISKQKQEYDSLLKIDNRVDSIYDLITNSNTLKHNIIKKEN